MRFREFLSESEEEFDLEKFENDCAPFLEELHKTLNLAYRGSKNSDEWKILSKPTNRKPRNTPWQLHDEVNEFFEKEFKWKARNGLFVVGSIEDARRYGNVAAIFPIGQFQSLWSPDVEDLTEIFTYHSLMTTGSYKVRSAAAINLTLKDIKSYEWLHNVKLQDGLETNNEIMLDCDKYYSISISSIVYEDKVLPFLKQHKYFSDAI